jgi:hypothetical protein
VKLWLCVGIWHSDGEEKTQVQPLGQVTKYCIDIMVYYEICSMYLLGIGQESEVRFEM